jgi:hypothetical protein
MRYDELRCEVCGIHMSVTALHRANPTGEKARWRCAPHLGRSVDPTILAVTDAMQLGVDPAALPDVTVVAPSTPDEVNEAQQ